MSDRTIELSNLVVLVQPLHNTFLEPQFKGTTPDPNKN